MKKESNSAPGLEWELETRGWGAFLKIARSLGEKNAACLPWQARPWRSTGTYCGPVLLKC